MQQSAKPWLLFLAAVFLFAVPLMIQAGQAAPPGSVPAQYPEVIVGGRYDVFGKNPDGSLYDGTVTIVETKGIFQFSWVIANGDLFQGTGQFEADRIVVHWGAKHPVIYEVAVNGVLRGVWADGTATETLVRK